MIRDTVRATLQKSERAPGTARRILDGALAKFDAEAVADAAGLIVSELVTNAVLHAAGPIHLNVYVDSGLLFIEVTDSASGVPAMRHADADAEGGRGLLLVDAYAADWGTEDVHGGKRVWASVNLDPDAEPQPAGCVCGYFEDPPTVVFEKIAA